MTDRKLTEQEQTDLNTLRADYPNWRIQQSTSVYMAVPADVQPGHTPIPRYSATILGLRHEIERVETITDLTRRRM